MADELDIRAELHSVIGHLRRNEIIDAYELVNKCSKQMDAEYYANKVCSGCGEKNCDCIPF